MVSEAARRNPAIRLLPYQPRETLSHSLSAGDLHLVTQDANTEGLIEPSKLYGVMAVGRPVLYVGPDGTDVARTVQRESIGEVVANGDSRRTAEAIARMLSQGNGMGARARSALERMYGRKRGTSAIVRVLHEALADRP
jgi:glycosyltransferase involved in cell wall biosynthesis